MRIDITTRLMRLRRHLEQHDAADRLDQRVQSLENDADAEALMKNRGSHLAASCRRVLCFDGRHPCSLLRGYQRSSINGDQRPLDLELDNAKHNFPARVPVAFRSCAAPASARGNTFSIVALSLPESTSFAISSSSATFGLNECMPHADAMRGRFLRRRRPQDRHEDSALLDHLVGAIGGFAANRVEDHIHIVHHVLKARRVVVDHLIGAERTQKFMVARRRGSDHARALDLRQLHGEVPAPPAPP